MRMPFVAAVARAGATSTAMSQAAAGVAEGAQAIRPGSDIPTPHFGRGANAEERRPGRIVHRLRSPVSDAELFAAGRAAADATPQWAQPPGQPSAAPGKAVSAEEMIGHHVRGKANEVVGEVDDVILDPWRGRIRAAAVGAGGVVGIGRKTVAIDLEKIQVRPEEGIYIPDMTKEALRGMQAYDADAATVSLDRRVSVRPAPDNAPSSAIVLPVDVVPADN